MIAVARTAAELESGMSGRDDLDGMVFAMPDDGPHSFWNRGCAFPLTLYGFGAHGGSPVDGTWLPSEDAAGRVSTLVAGRYVVEVRDFRGGDVWPEIHERLAEARRREA